MFFLTLSASCPLRFLNKASPSSRLGIAQCLILEVSSLVLTGCKVLLVHIFPLNHCDVEAAVCHFLFPNFVARK